MLTKIGEPVRTGTEKNSDQISVMLTVNQRSVLDASVQPL
jgi:hypothetical protein